MPDERDDDVDARSATGSSAHPRRRRPFELLHAKSTLTQLIVALLLAALGFAAVAQVRLTRNDDDFSGQRREDLIELLDSLAAASDRSRQQIDELERTRAELQTGSERRQIAVAQAQDRLAVLQVLTGTVPVNGPGVNITIRDTAEAVQSDIVLDAVEELRDAGAEAIEINDVARVVASTSFTDSGGVISADKVELRPPYVIDVIGSSHTLSDAVIFPGGLQDQVEQTGGTVTVSEADLVEVGSLHTIQQPEYSQPTGR